METVPVIFRADRSGPFKGEVTAVLPTIPAGPRDYATAYAHVGQHSGCDRGWYLGTRPASPEEYAPLLAELRGIYHDCRLVVRQRVTRDMIAKQMES